MIKIPLNIQKFAENTVEVEFAANSEEMKKVLKETRKELSMFGAGINALSSSVKQFGVNVLKVGNAFNSWNLSGITKKFTSLGNSLYKDFLSKAIDTSEELNLFNVVFNNIEKNGETTFSKLGREATKFQNKLNEAFGTNKKETMRYQGLFQAMGESAGLSDEISKVMSENMTKLSYDLASLYNTTETRAAESLRAGVYAGQTKPLRNYGIDVTQTSFKPLMEELGLEKSVNELTQAEKEILRYITTLRQAKNAMGDFANTIESPANQLKVLKQQFYEMQAAIGTLFVGAFARILPYVNAIIMVIKHLARTIASFFGIKMKDYNTGIASYADGLEEYADSLDDVGSSAGGASNAIKALRRQILAFDQINNLTSPTPSSSSGGGGGSSALDGIDEKLLEALEEYDNGMEKVRMKAIQIRDKIMEWLGFTKEINEETGEVEFKYDTVGKKIDQIAKEIGTNLGKMLNFYTNKVDWAKLGEYLALGLNTAFGFMDAFVQTYDWRNLGNKIATFFNKAIKDTDFSLLGRILTDKLRIAILSLTGFLEKFDFKQFGKKLGELINSAVKNIPIDELADGLNALVDGIEDAISALVKEVDWGTLITNMVELLSKLDWDTKLMLLAPIFARAIAKLLGSAIITKTIGEVLVRGIGNAVGRGGLGSLTTKGVKTSTAGKAASTAGSGSSLFANLGQALAIAEGLKANFDVGNASKNLTNSLYKGKKIDMKSIFGFDKPEDLGDWLKVINTFAYPIFGGDTAKTSARLGKNIADLQNVNLSPEEKRNNIMKSLTETYKGAKDDKDSPLHFLTEWADSLVSFKNQISDTFDGIKQKASDIWTGVKEKTEEIWGGITTFINENVVVPIQDFFSPLTDFFSNLWYGISTNAEEVWNNVTGLVKGCVEAIKLLWENGKKWISDSIIEPIKQKFTELWTNAKTKASEAYNGVVEIWNKITTWVNENIVNPVKTAFENVWGSIKNGASQAWEGIKNVFSPVVNWFKDKFSQAWQAVKNVFSTGGQIFVGIKEGIESTFRTIVNGIIRGINAIISKPFNTINNIITKLKSISIAGIKPFEGKLSYISVPQIPYMANGGMLSAGQLFVAREAGPELVGKMGNRTTVANNQQIVAGIEKGVYNAVKNAISNDGVNKIEIVAHTDEGVVIDRINRITRQTGSCPIEV